MCLVPGLFFHLGGWFFLFVLNCGCLMSVSRSGGLCRGALGMYLYFCCSVCVCVCR